MILAAGNVQGLPKTMQGRLVVATESVKCLIIITNCCKKSRSERVNLPRKP